MFYLVQPNPLSTPLVTINSMIIMIMLVMMMVVMDDDDDGDDGHNDHGKDDDPPAPMPTVIVFVTYCYCFRDPKDTMAFSNFSIHLCFKEYSGSQFNFQS